MTDLCTPHFHRVTDFMLRAKQECPLVPTMPTEKVRELRAKLILEEALETIKALGFNVVLHNADYPAIEMYHLAFTAAHEPNLTDIVDGCADISVVTIGTLIACGVKDEPVLECVDENNLAKFGPGHSYREDGKLIKPPNHRKADFDLVIRKQKPSAPLAISSNSEP